MNDGMHRQHSVPFEVSVSSFYIIVRSWFTAFHDEEDVDLIGYCLGSGQIYKVNKYLEKKGPRDDARGQTIDGRYKVKTIDLREN